MSTPEAWGSANGPQLLDGEWDRFRNQKVFGSLDGLRAISIAAVLWHHTGGKDINDIGFWGRGYYGVHLFFAISGFLIVTLLLREKSRNGEISLRNFYIRRTLRIFPLFYLVLLVYVGLVYLVERNQPHGQAFFANLPYFATYTSNWFVDLQSGRNIFYYSWSLATEEQFYLVWPWVEKIFKGIGAVVTMVCVIVLAETVRMGGLLDFFPPDGLPFRIVTTVAIPICLGTLLAHLLHSKKGYGVARLVFGNRWSAPVAMGAAAFVIGTELHTSPLLIGVVMTAIVASCVLREDHVLAPILTSAPFRHVGMVSYGMYLWHMLTYHAFVHPLHLKQPLVLFGLEFAATVGVATLSYKYYESRFLALKDRFAR